ncbi:uncharacterized protein DS421_4g116870 [Arachis hypogaea]|nr:uncharacterized protein DS421_4g116870 [Arachis hypogaea]
MSHEEATLPFHRRCCHGCGRGYPVTVGGSTTLATVPSESATVAVGLLVAAVVVGLLCMVAEKPFCHWSCPETPSKSDSTAAGVLRPPEPPPELRLLLSSLERLPVRVSFESCCCHRFEIAAASYCHSVLLGLLRMWLEAEVAVVDFGLRQKGLCETFGL